MSPNVFSVSQDYLRLLEAEAEAEIEIEMNDELEQTSIENNNEQELILNKRKLINNQQDFEQALKKGFPESYDLYKDLNNTKKETIYSNFKIHKRLYNSSVNIISMYLSTH
ncbi:MAG: hypothetical protein KAI02_08195 [Gammaproteobacteria bacterium]|nr:hypothetical protein [Gammaproteobacteria bacterium]